MRHGRSRITRATVILLAVWLPLMAISPAANAAPLKFLSRSQVRSGIDRVLAFLDGSHQPTPLTPRQQTGTAAGRPHEVPAAITRAVARASGHGPGTGSGQLPAYQVHQPKVHQFTTGAAIGTGHFNAQTSTLIASKSTATSDWYQNADGTYTRDVYAAPVNYQTSSGAWAPINTQLVPAAGGGWREAANSVGASFAAQASAASLGSLVFGGQNNGSFGLSFGLAGAADSPGTASGSSVTYPSVLPDTDLVETTTAVGISESLVLHSAQAPTTWLFPLQLNGLTPVLRSDGSIALEDASGTVQGTIPGGLATDASGQGKPGAITPVTYQLVTYNGGPALQASIPASWLTSPGRVFPVTVDPSVNSTVTGSTTVLSPYNADFSGNAMLYVGTYDAQGEPPVSPTPPIATPTGTQSPSTYYDSCDLYNCAESYLQFGGLSTTLAGDSVTAATLNVWDAYATNCASPEPFWVGPIEEPWNVTGPKQWPGLEIGTEIGEADTTAPAAACSNSTANPTVGGWMNVNLDPGAFNPSSPEGSSGSGVPGQPAAEQYGLALLSSFGDDNQWKEFDSFNTPNAPYLSLTYTPLAAPQISAQYPPDNYNSPSLTPVLMASGTEAAGVTAPLEYDFTVYNSSGSTVTSSGYTTSSQWTVPWSSSGSTDLDWGEVYYWTVQAYNGTTYSTPSPISYFSTNVPQPVLTSDLSQNTNGPGFNAADGDYSTEVTDAQVTTVGPALEVDRYYNSRDPRISGAFGAGWSSVLDMGAVPGQVDSAGNTHTIVLTYPDGEEVAYGIDAGGAFAPPAGRYAVISTPSGGGYTLVDKDDTNYNFGAVPTSGGPYTLGGVRIGPLNSITDAYGNTLTLTRNSAGEVTQMTSASGRSLYFTWSTPSGAEYPHVATVSTNPVVAGNSSTALTWTYSYTGDQLTSVCSPGGHCTSYSYTTGSDFPAAVLDTNPHSYWRLDESSGSVAASSVLVNEGADNATYSGVSLGQSGPLTGSPATSAGFNGTSSYLQLPTNLVSGADVQSMGMWFKTTTAGGVLLSDQASPVTGAQSGSYTPELYIGSDGKLRGEFFTGSVAPITSANAVDDGKWHYVLITVSGNTQTMYLDGTAVGSLSGTVSNTGLQYQYVGAGYLGGLWPEEPYYSTSSSAGTASYFNGDISDVAFWDQVVTANQVSGLYAAGTTQGNWLTKVTRPTGSVYAQVAYNGVTGAWSTVTDSNGGTWTMGPTTVTGSSQEYVGSVLGADPTDYYRLADTGTATATDQVKGGTAAYNNVTQGVAGPFPDATADSFNGTSSYLALPNQDQVTTGPGSIELWFQTTSDDEVLYSANAAAAGSATISGGYMPSLYIGSDGKLIGSFSNQYPNEVITSASPVNDGRWHFVVLAASTTSQSMYLDGNLVGTNAGNLTNSGATSYVYLGTGYLGGSWPDEPHESSTSSTGYASYFTGSMAEFAAFGSQLSAAEVGEQWTAAKASQGLSPVQTAQVTDPGGNTLSWSYDPLNGYRLIAETDGDGDTTRYGYDSNGFLSTVTDPDGDVTSYGYDVRGNMVSQTTCQNQAADDCSTSYYTYYPDDTTLDPTPDPRNDMMTASLDPRSASATDTRYKTSYNYNSFGELTSVTDPPVAGYPSGLTTTLVYTCDWAEMDGSLHIDIEPGTTCVDAVNGTPGGTTSPYPPGGLPYTTTTPGGAVTTYLYYLDGDVAQVTDPDGQVTKYTYDGLGRVTAKTVTSNAYPSGLTTTFTYAPDGQVATETDPAVTDRVTGAVHTAQISTSYDADGDVLSQTVADTTGGDASRTESFTYNGNDLLASDTDADGNVTKYTYDAYGDVASETDPAGNVTDYGYDATGQLLTVTLQNYTGNPSNPTPPAPLVESSRAYDPAGRLASITDSMGWVTSYGYTDNGLVATVTRSNPATGASDVEEANTYDLAGNLIAQVTNNGATTTDYTVDAADRQTSQTLDPSGLDRTTSISYTPDDYVASETLTGAGSSTPVRSTSYTYDPMGNVTSQSQALQGGGNTPTAWWPLNQTSGTSVPDASGTGHTATASNVTWSNGAENNGDVTTTGPVLDTTSSFTVSAWVDPTQTFTAGSPTAVSQDGVISTTNQNGQTTYANSGFTLGITGAGFGSGGNWSFSRPLTTANNSTFATAKSSGAASYGTWTHLVGVYNASTGTMTLYVNGTAVGTATDTTPAGSYGVLAIGRAETPSGTTGQFLGAISDVQVYQQALTSSQVSALYTLGRLGGVNPANKLTTTWTLDQRGLPTSMTDPDGNVTYYSYDQAGRLAVTTAPTVTTQTYGNTAASTAPVTMTGYNTFGDAVESSDANGNVTVTGYDADSNPVSVTDPSYTPPGSSTPITAVSTSTYNSLGQVTAETDPLGNKTSYSYDQLGDVASVTAPDGGVTSYTYDTDGDQLSVTGPTGAASQATYDYLGRMLTSTQLERYPSTASYTTSYAYADPAGWLSSQTSPDGVSTSYGYDAAGEQTSMTDGAGNTTSYVYDAAGDLTSTAYPDGTSTTTTYDEAGRPTGTADVVTASGTVLRSASAAYNGDGDQVSATDYRGNTNTFAYNADGSLTQEVQPVSATSSITTSFKYDPDGNRTEYTDGNGNQLWTTYNTWNLPESEVEPTTAAYSTAANSTFTTAYDADGRPVTLTEPGGVSVTDSYDSMGDVTGQSGSGAGAATPTRSFGYDLLGDLTSASTTAAGSQAATSESFTYDDRGLLLTASGSGGSSSFSYNGDGQVTSVNDAAGTTGYTYDTAGRLATLSDPATGTTLSYSYNAMDDVSGISYGSGANTRSFGYNNLNELTSDALKTASGATVASISYGYDPNGNLTSKTTAGFAGATTNTYTYDDANRLMSWNNGTTTTDYGYDADGNLTQDGSKTYTYDARDELTSDGVDTYSYTANGDLASEVTPTGTLTGTTDAYGDQVTGGPESMQTDALGRTLSVSSPGQTATLSYVGTSGLVSSDGTSTYTWDPSGNLTGIGQVGAGTSTAVLAYTDAHTDVVGNFTATGSSLTGSTSYDPWGNVTTTTGTPAGRLGYQSQYTDPVFGQVDMGSRWYAPYRAGFDNADTASNDPVPDSAAANPFAYANDNPLDGIDPTGHAVGGLCEEGGSCGSVQNQEATHPCNSACEAQPPQPTSLAGFTPPVLQAKARPPAPKPKAKAKGCAWYNVGCHLSHIRHDVAHTFDKARHDVAAAADDVADAVYDGTTDVYQDILRPSWAMAQRIGRDTVNAVKDAAEFGIHTAGTVISYASQAGTRIYHAATQIIHRAVNVVKTAWHAVKKAATKTVQFIKHHAAAITGIVVGIAVFAGCEAATVGVGTIGCAALAGAASNMASYAVTAAQTGRFSVTGLLMSGVTGAVTGALTAGLLEGAGGLAGGLLSSGADDAASSAADGAVDDAADDTTGSAADTADASSGDADADAGARSGDDTGDSCITSGGQSFTAGTKVLLASGAAVAISQLKVGEKVLATNTRTGKTQAETVAAVLVHHDTDLYDLKVKANGRTAVIDTTSSHLFWDAATRRWIKAAALKYGTHLRTPSGSGTATVLGGYTPQDHSGWMWDLTVPGNNDHDFYVTADSSVYGSASIQVLVHNENEGCDESLPPYAKVFQVQDSDPQDELPRSVLIEQGQELQPGDHHYVVMENGEFRAAQSDEMYGIGPDSGHTSLSESEPVIMAGHFSVDGTGSITEFDNWSGHYRPEDDPEYTPLEQVARAAFGRFGLSGEIANATWSPISYSDGQ
jgi:RHS repeat-associated protein